MNYPTGLSVLPGGELTPTDVKDVPEVAWPNDSDYFYTLIMTDPDAPSRADPKMREFCHWVVVNIPGNAVAEGETLYEYIGAGAPEGTGLHRYVFLVYRQHGRIDASAEPIVLNTSAAHRGNFSARKFAKKYNFGDLVAGNFFQAQFDDYVPILHEQLQLA